MSEEIISSPTNPTNSSSQTSETSASTDALLVNPNDQRRKPHDRNAKGKKWHRDAKWRWPKEAKEFQEVMLEVRRVTRVTTGGRKLSFRAAVLVGNKKGKIGYGVSKWPDVVTAVQKATHQAYKTMISVPINTNGSIPYTVNQKYKSAMIRLLPAAQGTGLKAGSALRLVLELAGYSNILSKIIGTNNKLNNVLAALSALGSFKQERVKQSNSDTMWQESDTIWQEEVVVS
jgi:small subunit ribosomal protein S5